MSFDVFIEWGGGMEGWRLTFGITVKTRFGDVDGVPRYVEKKDGGLSLIVRPLHLPEELRRGREIEARKGGDGQGMGRCPRQTENEQCSWQKCGHRERRIGARSQPFKELELGGNR